MILLRHHFFSWNDPWINLNITKKKHWTIFIVVWLQRGHTTMVKKGEQKISCGLPVQERKEGIVPYPHLQTSQLVFHAHLLTSSWEIIFDILSQHDIPPKESRLPPSLSISITQLTAISGPSTWSLLPPLRSLLHFTPSSVVVATHLSVQPPLSTLPSQVTSPSPLLYHQLYLLLENQLCVYHGNDIHVLCIIFQWFL